MSEDTNSIYCNATGPILLSYEKSLLAGPPKGELFNDYGFVVRARAETGEDIHLWSFIYQQTGPEVIIDGDVSQTLLVYGKYTDEEKQYMHPEMPTVNKGQNIEDYYPPGSLKVREGKDDVTWTLGGRVHHGTPTKWLVSGEHAGVKVDIVFEQRNPAFYHCGRFEDLKEGNTGTAGYIVHTTASGTIEVHGKTLKFTNGHGIHERIIQNGKVPDRTGYMSGRGLHWMHGFSEGFTWYLMRGDIGKGMGTAMINIGGEQIVLHNPSSSGVEEVAHWIDPVSKIISP